MKDRISIVIPTRERPDTFEYCLKTVTALDYDNLDIIISDNYSCDGTQDIANSAKDPRIKYFNTGKRLSMSHNFEFALSKVAEGWIVVIGDDDGLLPDGLRKPLELLKETGRLALASESCFYRWPTYRQTGGSNLVVPMRKGYDLQNSKVSIKKLMKGTTQYAKLPMLYTGGIVHSSLVRKIRGEDGIFFRSLNPDIYSAIAISSIVDDFIYLHEPFAISGLSKNSNGGSIDPDDDNLTPKGESQKFLSEDNMPFHSKIPLFLDGRIPTFLPALIYESYLQSRHLHNNFARVTPRGQLEKFLSDPLIVRGVLRGWVKEFATVHNININECSSNQWRTKFPIACAKIVSLILNAVEQYRMDSSFGMKIRDVYEASIVASTILATKPNLFMSNRRTLRRKFFSPSAK